MSVAVGFSGERPPTRFNLTEYVVGRSARRLADKVALITCDRPDGHAGETWTYREIEDACLRGGKALIDLGSGLEHAFGPGDRVLILLPNTSLYATTFFGAIAVGLIPIPASRQLTVPEISQMLADSGARIVITDQDLSSLPASTGTEVRIVTPAELLGAMAAARPAAYRDTGPDDAAYLIYTSGTTSRPKGVLHGHRAAWGRRPMYRGWYGMRESDRMLHAGAFNWTYTLGTGLTDPWANGATAIVYTGTPSPDIWPQLIRSQGATLFAAVPSLYRRLLKYAERDLSDLGDLRHGLMAGEQPPTTLVDEWRETTGLGLYEALGMSEVSTYISSGPETPTRRGYAGRAQPGRSIAILPEDAGTEPLPPGQEGLLAVHRSDPALMLGYWNRPDEESEVFRGDWFIGGDLAIMDQDGYIAHRGRSNDLMKALGYRVSPMEVEAALQACPGIAEVACAEIKVKADVTVVGAFIVPSDPAVLPAREDLEAFAAGRLAAYKCPRHYTFLDALPRTANGKVKRNALAAMVTVLTEPPA